MCCRPDKAFVRHPARALALLSDTALCIFQRGIHGLTAAGGVEVTAVRTAYTRGGHLRNIEHDIAFLGVIHGGSDAGSFANCSPEDFSATAPSGLSLFRRLQTALISQQVVFRGTLSPALLFGLAALIRAQRRRTVSGFTFEGRQQEGDTVVDFALVDVRPCPQAVDGHCRFLRLY